MKTYTIREKQYQFDFDSFNDMITEYKHLNRHLKVGQIEQQIADAAFVSADAVHKWRMKKNQPDTYEAIVKISISLGLKNEMILLKEIGEITEGKMDITARQKDALQRVYNAVIEFLNNFYKTKGFTDYWFFISNTRKQHDPDYPSTMFEMQDEAYKAHHEVEVALRKEYFSLHKLPIYTQLLIFVEDDLSEAYEDTINFRHKHTAERITEDGTITGVSANEDYLKMVKTLNEIMAPYLD